MTYKIDQCVWNYKHCLLNSSKLIKRKRKKQFYENYIDLFYKNNFKSKFCKKCKCNVNQNWFNENETFKIYNNIYPQHHRGWKNFNRIFSLNEKKNILKIVEIQKRLSAKSIAEFNCPFSGLFLNYYLEMYSILTSKRLINKAKKLLKINQLANFKTKKKLDSAFKNFKHTYAEFKNLKKEKKDFKELYFFNDNSTNSWNYGCISEGVNCRSLSSLLFDYTYVNFYPNFKKKINLDLFIFADTLDHSQNPSAILNYALRNSKYVIIIANAEKNVTNQHRFSLSQSFKVFFGEKFNVKKIFFDKKKKEIAYVVSKYSLNIIKDLCI
jgi:hypothetical protein